jgi:hypothetical protein
MIQEKTWGKKRMVRTTILTLVKKFQKLGYEMTVTTKSQWQKRLCDV